MSQIIGIDLGTTYSAVAIPGERTDPGFMVLANCPGYSVILDDRGRRITPSVVAEDSKGQILVGYAAKARAGFSPTPIAFAKRYMGTAETFQLAKQGTLTPAQVSAHILRYLKEVAERRLGEPVKDAVITVPAYFDMQAKMDTETAGKEAGLNVLQIAQEPVAAALMYCINDDRDPLRVMTYDLGGGTFDVAILEKRDGTISKDSLLAFDGDPLLGGYNFDRFLATWMAEQLRSRGYDIQIDWEDPADSVVCAKLMQYAEQTKIAVSGRDTYELLDPVANIKTRSGETIDEISLTISRDEFEAMIREKVEYSIKLCHRAIEKSKPPIQVDELDEILMVGGSSRIPMIGRLLEAEFGRKPRLIEPDLCVALGAAIIAGTQRRTYGRLTLSALPRETANSTFDVTGKVQMDSPQALVVALESADGIVNLQRRASAEGGFLFEGVKLTPETTTEFSLAARTQNGQTVAEHSFSIKQSARAKGGLVEAVMNVTTKPLGILFDDGFNCIVPEKTGLPCKETVKAQTRDNSGIIRVPVHEENTLLGEILLDDIPATLAVGSIVDITMTVQTDYQILVEASIPSLGHKKKTGVFRASRRERKSWDELAAEYKRFVKRWQNTEPTLSRGAKIGDPKVIQFEDDLEEVGRDLDSRQVDPMEVQNRLDEMESLLRGISVGWKPEPHKAVVDAKMQEAEELLAQLISAKPRIADEGYDKQIEAIRNEAEKAYTAQDTARWKQSFAQIVRLCDTLNSLLEAASPRQNSNKDVDPSQLLMSLSRELQGLEREARNIGRYDALKKRFDTAAQQLRALDPRASDFMQQVREWYFDVFQVLHKEVFPEQLPPDAGLLGRVQ